MVTRTPVAVALGTIGILGTAFSSRRRVAAARQHRLHPVEQFRARGGAPVRADGRGAGGDRHRQRPVPRRAYVAAPASRARSRSHRVCLRGVRRGLRLEPGDCRHHRLDGGAGDDQARLRQVARARHCSCGRHARHPHPAERADDHLRRAHRNLDRRPVHRRYPAGDHDGVPVLGHRDLEGDPAAGARAALEGMAPRGPSNFAHWAPSRR